MKRIYKTKPKTKTAIQAKTPYEGEPLEYKIRRITNSDEAITDSAPLAYDDEDSDEIEADYNIRTDKWIRAENLHEQTLTDQESIEKVIQNNPITTDVETTDNQ